MNGKLLLNSIKCFLEGEITCEFDVLEDSFQLALAFDETKSLESQLNKKDIINAIKAEIEICNESDNLKIDDCIKLVEDIDNMINYFEYIEFDAKNMDLLNFLDTNPNIQSKKIIISDQIKVTDYDKVKKYIEKYNKYIDNIYVSMDNNNSYIKLEESFNTILKIKEQSERILNLNLSLMETIMYTYDLVRNRVYKEEKEGESKAKSRDLSLVLSNEEIVCVGYANIFQALLNYMGINCDKVCLSRKENPNIGHQRNILYIKDEKYGIDGVYYFDVTWDSKRKNENNEFLSRYKWFAKTREEVEILEKNKFNYIECPYYSDDMISEVKKKLNDNNWFDINKEYVKSLNYINELIENVSFVNYLLFHSAFKSFNMELDTEIILKKLENIESKFNQQIPAETFIKLLNNVRKIEYYENPNLYPYSIDDIFNTYMNSNWNFLLNHHTPEEILLLSIFGESTTKYDENRKTRDFINFACKEQKIDRNIKEVQLAKTLQKVYQKKVK